jgi:hypothetical protein
MGEPKKTTANHTTANHTTDLAEARRLHAALQGLLRRHAVGAADLRAMRRMLSLCQAAAEALDDPYCAEKLRLVGEYGAELMSRAEHARWGRDSVSGAEFLRQQALNALELFASRLYSIEALRRAAQDERQLPWTARTAIAQV